jgi:methyl-accepting chemotaxis protein-1 (serine sensor receptor)
VVESEVRSLAQRSAKAARQVKTLIGTSVERVEQGNAVVGQADSTTGEIVSAIRRVTHTIGEISTASAEQGAGVAQATQQNAAMEEKSAAAA